MTQPPTTTINALLGISEDEPVVLSQFCYRDQTATILIARDSKLQQKVSEFAHNLMKQPPKNLADEEMAAKHGLNGYEARS